MESYEEWDMTIPPIPPRSRFYRLEPIGIGTPYVESLTSYIARLSKEHCVSPKVLVTKEILPLQGLAATPQNYYYWANSFFKKASHSLNGLTTITTQWVETVQILTSREDLQYLTMLKWKDAIATEGLLRPRKSWCSMCYRDFYRDDQKIYDPLLWSLSDVFICLKHHQPLISLCPHCHSDQPLLAQSTYPGYCSKCTCWLGAATDTINQMTMGELRWHSWCAEAVGEMLAHAPVLQITPSKEHTATMVNTYLEQYAQGNLTELARLLRISTSSLKTYLEKQKNPQLSSLLSLCYKLNSNPLDFLTLKNTTLHNMSASFTNDIQEKNHKKYSALTNEELEYAKQLLDAALEQKTRPYTKLSDITQIFSCHVSTLKRHFPSQCQAIRLRSRGQWTREEDRSIMKRELEKALTNDKRPPVLEVARFIGCDVSTLRRYFPDLYQLVVVRYREAFLDKSAREQAQREMQEIFAEGNKTLSVSELAKRVGYSEDALRIAFPGTCKQFADRRRTNLREQHLVRMNKISDEVRQIMFELHEIGIYPSATKISESISYKHAIRTREGYNTWKATLVELGY